MHLTYEVSFFFHFAQRAIGPYPIQLVVVTAVRKAVSAATITFTTTSINRFVFIIINYQLSTFNYQLSTSEAPANAFNLRLPGHRCCSDPPGSDHHRSRRSGSGSHHHRSRCPPPLRRPHWSRASPLRRCGRSR